MALPAGFSPASIRLEDGCLICSATAASKWSEWQDFHLRSPGPKPGALKTELHSVKNGGPEGNRTLNLPADNPDKSGLIELRVQKWWEVLVTLQFDNSSFV